MACSPSVLRLVLVVWAQTAFARRYHNNLGDKPHPHTYLAFCVDMGVGTGQVIPLQCTVKQEDAWPVKANLLSWLHPKNTECTGIGNSDSVPTATGGKCELRKDQQSLSGDDLNNQKWPIYSENNDGLAFRPVIVALGNRENNPHHTRYPYRPDGWDWNTFQKNLEAAAAGSTYAAVRALVKDMDPTTISTTDRIELRDGLMLSTSFALKYTPQKCAELCARMVSFRGNQCLGFTRKWMHTDIDEHSDACGRDGDNVKPTGLAPASSGAGSYTYRGQCVFFGKYASTDDGANFCSTVADWLDHGPFSWGFGKCKNRHTTMAAATNFKDKARSWVVPRDATLFTRATLYAAGFTAFPANTPTTPFQKGRRLEGSPQNWHKLTLPNGSSFWAFDPPPTNGTSLYSR